MSKPHSPMMSRVRRRIARQLTTGCPTTGGPATDGRAPRKTFSATDRCPAIIECWNTVAIHSRQRPMSPTRGAGSPPNRTVPASGAYDAGQDRDQGGLARPVAADQAKALARRPGKVNAAQGAGGAEPLLDTSHFNECPRT